MGNHRTQPYLGSSGRIRSVMGLTLALVALTTLLFDAEAANTATVVGNCQSVILNPTPGTYNGNPGVLYFSTLDGRTDIPPLRQLVGASYLYGGELRKRTAGLYESDYSTINNSGGGYSYYGSLVLNLASLDSDGVGIPDFAQREKPGTTGITGTYTRDWPNVVTVAITGNLTRSAGSTLGSYSIVDQATGGSVANIGGTMEVQTYTGSLAYNRGPQNTATITMSRTTAGATFNLSGSTSFTVTSADEIAMPQFQMTNSVGGAVYTVQATTFTRTGNKYVGNLRFTDGDLRTAWADSIDWVFVVTDLNDADGNGIPDLSDALPVAPALTGQPQGQSALAGASLSFTVAASGTAPLSYQWRKDGTNLTGATNSTYAIGSVQTTHAGNYTVVVTNVAGSTTSAPPAVLVVNMPPSISTQPLSQSVTLGDAVSFVVSASGTAPLSYQWRKDSADIAGATGASLTLSNVQTNQAGNYTVVITNAYGSVTSSVAILAVSRLAQTVTFGSLPGKRLADAPFILNATASSGLPVSYASSNPDVAAVTGGTVTITRPGTTIITASQAGDATYLPTSVGHALRVVVPSTVLAWGNNSSGEATVPVGLSGVTAIAAGGGHTVALMSDGTVVAWGRNDYGQATVPAGLSGVVAIEAGGAHTVALKSDGTVRVWGWNLYGQTNVPIGLSGVTDIAVGGAHTMALKTNGTLVAWGNNDYGETNVPSALSGVTAIAGGGAHTVAVKSDGTVVAWGYPFYGVTTVPSELTGVTAIAAGGDHTLALKNDGTLVAWGASYFNINFGQTTVPVGLSGVTAIAAGVFHNVALKGDGTVTAWGANDYGQTTVPTNLNGVTAIAAGDYHSVALVPMPLPTIATQPGGLTVLLTSNATFSVTAAGIGPFTYQWSKDGTNLAGATGSSYSILNAQTNHAGSYLVVVSNVAGSATSAPPAVLVVNVPPGIAQQPVDQSVVVGSGAAFNVTATGSAPFTYQWRKDGTNLAGAMSNSYSIANAQTNHAGGYSVVVSSSFGSITSSPPAVLTVNVPPSISQQPADQAVVTGNTAMFSVSVSGTAPFSYQWRKDGTNLTGATGSSYSIANAQTNHTGGYTVVVGNVAGSVTSAPPASLVVNVPPAFTSQPLNQTVVVGSGTAFNVSVSGTAPFTYQWRKDGTNLAGATGSAYSIANAQTNHAGVYTVVVSNSFGSATSAPPAVLTVNVPPTLTLPPVDQTVLVGTGAAFSVTASGTAPFSYQWRKDGTNLAGATSSTYSIANALTNHVGGYTVVVSNVAGSVTSAPSAMLIVNVPAAIANQPASQTVLAGNPATFSVTASGTAPFTYQWRKDGTNLAGATSATLTLSNVQTNQAGNYVVVITNAYGSVTSSVAALTVNRLVQTISFGSLPSKRVDDAPFMLSATASSGLPVSYTSFNLGVATVSGNTVTITGLGTVIITASQSGDATYLPTSVGQALRVAMPGTVVAWGYNGSGETTIPAGLSGVTALGVGESHTVALKNDGKVVVWGDNLYGQVSVPFGLGGVVAIAAGTYHNVALKSDGTSVAWGAGTTSSGYPNKGQSLVPVGLSELIGIAAGDVHTVALKADGTVVAWGDNTYGQTAVPAGLGGVIAIAAGGLHTVVLRSDGTVVAWGDNGYGQTGIPPGLNGVTAIASGGDHVVALKNDGRVIAWGASSFGQTTVPNGLSGVVAIAAGFGYSMALKSDGTVVAWGYNYYGQTTGTPSDAPYSATANPFTLNGVVLGGVTVIAAGSQHAVAAGAFPPIFTIQPQSQTVILGTNVVFTVAVNGTAPLSYQWRKSGSPITGANSATLVLNNVQFSDASTYDVVITNPVGSTTSSLATLAVYANRVLSLGGNGQYATIPSSPAIQPSNAITVELWFLPLATSGVVLNKGDGQDASSARSYEIDYGPQGASFQIFFGTSTYAGISAPAPVNQWVHFAATYDSATSRINIFTNGILAASTTNNASGSALNGSKMRQTTLPLTFGYIPGLQGTYFNGSMDEVRIWNYARSGAEIFRDFHARLAGTEPGLVGYWQFDGATVADLTTNANNGTLAGGAQIVAISGADIPHLGAPTITAQPLPQTVLIGTSATFSLQAEGASPLTYQWRKDGTNLTGATSSNYSVAITQPNHVGAYTVVVSNSFGSVTSAPPAMLTLNLPPAFTSQPVIQTVVAGETATFSVTATGTEPFTYQWRKDGTNLTGATGSGYSIANTQTNHAGGYTVVVSSSFGSITSSPPAVLTVNLPPTITQQPVSQTILAGATVTFSVTASGTAPFTYQWRKDGTNLAEATGSSYALARVQPAHAGGYSVLVSNVAGSVTSSTATLTLNFGTVVAWVRNTEGQTNVPLGLNGVVAMAGGGYHNLALKADGTIVTWGHNDQGQGIPPVQAQSGLEAVAGGAFHSLALKNDGTVVAWGRNVEGQTNVPAGFVGAVAVSGGAFHSLALLSNGTVAAWGRNDQGQGSVPVGLTGVTAVAGGGYHNLALKTNGTVFAWGFNGNGQTNVPPALSGAVAVSGGGYHSVALKSDGTVVAWGDNAYGQTNVPVGLSGVVAVSAGFSHNLALKSDGTVVAWGLNDFGQQTVPTGLSGVMALSAGYYHNLALVPAPSPGIPTAPVSLTVNAASNATFSVTPTGSGPFSFRWLKDGVLIAGQTNAQLNLTGLTNRGSGGNFSVMVSNLYGAITGNIGSLRVRVPHRLQPPVATNGMFRLLSADQDGGPLTTNDLPFFSVQTSTNLASSNWLSFTYTNGLSLTNGMLRLDDTNAASRPVRYYRVIEQ